MAGLLAIVAHLGATRVTVSSGRATAVSVESTVAAAVGSAVLGGVVLLRLLGELNGDAGAAKIGIVQFLDCLIGILLILVINEGVISLW